MKKSELRQIIKEEISKVLKEGSITRYNQGDDISILAREVAKIIGMFLDPNEFYEYLRYYLKQSSDAEQLKVLEDAFSEIEQADVKDTELYKQYIAL